MKVCLDPEHGGYDPGAVGNGYNKYNTAAAVAKYLS
ncbi:N-acetylmuramoyl-L-alanine amidase [Desulfosporosinus sp. BG]|nr:N-acetylmuramoyl-L-alanine amidase [Desulfosporosinus sp. BG]